jgi:anti-sigma factor RsiW
MKPQRPRPSGHDINCAKAVSLVTDYLDGTLTRAERARFEAHLSECDNCTEHIKQIHVTIAAAGHVGDEDLDPLVREDLMNLYRRWRGDRPS